MSSILQLMLTKAYTAFGAAQAAVDPYFKYVSLLLNGDSLSTTTTPVANGSFVDSGNNGLTVTASGTPTQGTFSPFSNNGWSASFNGSTDYVSAPSNAAFALPGDFTIECWVNFSSVANGQLISAGTGTNTGAFYWQYYTSQLQFGIQNVGGISAAAWTPVAGRWYHIAVVRSGTTVTQYVDGTILGTTATSSQSFVAGQCYIGFGGAGYFNGSISNARIVKGTAVYTANFTPPTAPLTAISGTSLLTLQDNRFKDNSTNNFALTVTGTPKVVNSSPFPATSVYSAATNSGSIYFGSGLTDYLQVPASASFAYGTSDFTIEAWVYPQSFGDGGPQIFTQSVSGTNYFVFGLGTTGIPGFTGTSSGGGTAITGPAAVLNQWNHIAAVRSAGVVTVYTNGVAGTPAANTTNFTDTAYVPTVGRYTHTATNRYNGYMSDFRITNGTALYTAAFTPPTAPLSAVTNTVLLLKGTNAGIIDSTAKNDLVTVSTASVAYGTSATDGTGKYSTYFNGTTDNLTIADNAAFAFGTGDFTIEAWIYNPDYTAANGFTIYSQWQDASNIATFNYRNTSGLRFVAQQGGTNVVVVDHASTSGYVANQWTHVALTRQGSVFRIFRDGVQLATQTTAVSLADLAGPVYLGANAYSTGPTLERTAGSVSNLRVVKGTALYTANFTVPTSPLTAVAGTSLLTLQDNTFKDNSTNNFALAVTGTPKIQNANPFSTTYGSSLKFNGTSDTITIPSNQASLGTADFTIEGWIYPTNVGSMSAVWAIGAVAAGYVGLELNLVASGKLSCNISETGSTWKNYDISTGISTTVLANNRWYHVAVTRSGATITMWVNGVSNGQYTLTSSATALCTAAIASYLGSNVGSGQWYGGYIDDFRIIKGKALYAANFTPSVTALPDVDSTNGAYTALMLHGDKQSSTYKLSQNNSIVDSSANALPLTRAGNVTQGTFTPYSPNGWSAYFNGTSDYLTAPADAAFAFGTGDFTVEAWVNFNSTSGTYVPIMQGAAVGGGATNIWFFALNGGNTLRFATHSSGAYNASTPWTPSTGVWYHLAVTRVSGVTQIYINGVAGTMTGASTGSGYSLGQSGLTLGVMTTPYYLNGSISNVRIVKGTAVYTANFTPSTTPLTAITGTSLLTLQSNRFKDNSTNNFAITTTGTPKVAASSPFTSVAYSTATHGGSLYFNGGSDLITTPTGTIMEPYGNNFTIEFWWYPQSTARQWFVAASSDYWIALDYNSVATNKLGMWASSNGTSWNLLNADAGGNGLGTLVVPQNQWNHIAFVRNGTTWTLYLNGVIDKQVTGVSGSVVDRSTLIKKIGNHATAAYPVFGNIADFRYTTSAVYTAAFTPPTAPLTAINNTLLLLSGTNSALTDLAAKNDVQTVGNTRVDTITKKFGTGSLYIPTVSDGIKVANSQDLVFGSGDFTIEAWVYPTSTYSTYNFIYNRASGSTNAATDTEFQITSTGAVNIAWYTGSTAVSTTSSVLVSRNTWTHIAAVRKSGVTNIFINGVQDTVSSTNAGANNDTGSSSTVYIGQQFVGGRGLVGYIDDFRITKAAVYTSTFTPPTRESSLVTDSYDPYFSQNVLLLQANGANNAQNNTFVDSSTNALAITRNGNVTQGSFSPFSNNGWSTKFDGSASYLSSLVITNFSTSNFTIELWANFSSLVANAALIHSTTGVGNYYSYLSIAVDATGTKLLSSVTDNLTNAPNDYRTGSTTLTVGKWYHISLVRAGSVNTLYLDGKVEATWTSNILNGALSFFIGATVQTSGGGFRAYSNANISNLRVVRSAVYTAPFTPPTTQLTAIANTLLLTCQDGRLKDNSTNNFAINVDTGTIAVQNIAPFAVTTAYSPAVNGGSMYFDGTGDWVTTPNTSQFDLSSSTTQFTLEAWVYNTGPGTHRGVMGARGNGATSGWCMYIRSDNTLYMGSVIVGNAYADRQMNTTVIPANTWTHIAIVKTTTGYTGYVNGVAGTQVALTGGLDYQSAQPVVVGALGSSGELPFLGYIADARIVKGTALYTTAFTPPTAPLTAVANTQLLLSGQNAAVYDAAGHNVVETVGTAKLSTSQFKYGTSSLSTGTGTAGLTIPNSSMLDFGNKDFTIEFWDYRLDTGNRYYFQRQQQTSGASTGVFLILGTGSTMQVIVQASTDGTGAGAWALTGNTTVNVGTIVINTWQHWVFRRVGATFTVYCNGVQTYSANWGTTAVKAGTGPAIIGGQQSDGQYGAGTGYIDDFRITMGKGRYTVEPTAALPTSG